ncbi:hypothetical protein [Brevundimonas sp.]|jgi:hypothetical protein|uniref:hypothetical protein n=1 Tax=Brevundimonas sp. TaxID=1871086 RepID=UPI002E1177C0|nr:hypothetical protein [Brevundimonas sp.]
MTDFTPDFGGAPSGYEDVAGPLFLGLDPLMAALLAGLIALAGVIGFLMGRGGGGSDGDEEAVAKAIHKRVLKSAKEALSAESDRLVEKARALKDLVEDQLGQVKSLGGGLSGPMTAITNALEGKRPAAKPAAAAAATASPAASTTQNQTINVTVNAVPPPAPPPPPSGDLTGKEQIDELAKAVRAFHDWWSRKDDRVKELVGARRQLSRMPKDAAHEDDHGHGHDDAHKHGHGDGDGDAETHGDEPAAPRRPIWERKK